MGVTSQGGVASPILSNIYLDRLDQWVEGALFKDYNRGEDKRKSNLEYQRALYHKQRCRKAGDITGAKRWNKIQRQLPRYDVNDPDYRRLRYLRYADDFLLGFAGPKTEAGEIKSQLQAFLRDTLKLELSEEKTLITHSRTQAARFLGYDITNQHDDAKRDHRNARSINGVMALRVPAEVVAKHCNRYLKKGKPVHRTELTRNSDFDIVIRYQGEYRGVVNYYLLAHNLWWLNKVRWVMETSLLKTLAHKHKSSVMKMRKRYQTVIQTEYGPRKCLQVRVERMGKNPLIATFGGVPLRRRYGLLYKEPQLLHLGPQRTELVQRLLADQCELCHSRENVQVHHVKALKSLKVKGRREKPTWMQIMAARRRKTLIVCQPCHSAIHAGKPTRTPAVE